VDIRFWFEPENRGTTTTDITFFSNSVNGAVTTTLTGKGTAPVISVQRPGTDESVPSVSEIDFGSVRVNRPTSLTRVIKNTGDLPLIITAVTVENARFELLEPVIEDASSKTVPINGTLDLTVQFNPQQRGTAEDTLIIHSDAFNITQSRVMLHGQGTGPELAFVGDNKIIFGSVRAGQSETGSVVIKNTGDEPLTVSGVRSGTTVADVMSAFSWVPPFPGAASQTVAAGTTAMLTVRFKPTDTGDFEGALMIDSDAINMLERPLDVNGEGIASEMVIVITDASRKPEDITSSTLSHDFGNRPVGASTSREVFIANDGDASLEVMIPEIDDAEPFQWKKHFGRIMVPARESTSILTLIFKPDARGSFSTTLTFFSNAFNGTRTDIVLTGRGTVPMIGVEVNNERVASGASHFLGEFRKSKVTTVSMSVHNHGGADLEITGVELPESYSPQGLPDIPEIIRPSSGVEVLLPLMVKKTGLVTGNLVIKSKDPTTPTYTVELRSTGVAPVMVVQVGGTTMTSGATFNLQTLLSREVTTDIVVWNLGSADLEVDDIGLVSDGRIVEEAGRYRLPGGAMTIPKNTFHTWTLHFTPPDASVPHEESIRISNDNGEASTLTLHVHGVGTGPDLATSFRGCNRKWSVGCHLYDIRTGVTTSVELVIRNRGNELLTGTVTMTHGDPVYRVYSINQTGDFMLAPRESTMRAISFFPSDANPIPPGQSSKHRRMVQVEIRTNDPGERERVVSLWGQIVGPEMHVDISEPVPVYTRSTETRKREHDFRKAMVGFPKAAPVTIRNLGTEPLKVTASVSGGGYHLLNKDGSSAENRLITIDSGLDEPLDLRFAPLNISSPHEGVLTIVSNDYDEGMHTVSLTGHGIHPGMEVFLERDGNRKQYYRGDVYDLGDVAFGRPINTFIYLGNNSTASLNVSRFDVNDRGFSMETDLAALPERRIVESGVSAAYVGVLRFDPVQQGTHTGTLTIRSNDINGAEFTIPLRANAVSSGLDIRIDGELVNSGRGFSGEYDLGGVLVGESVTKAITIERPVMPAPVIRFIYFADDGGGQFDVVRPYLPSYPWHSSYPWRRRSLMTTLSFTPTEAGSATAVLVIREGGARILSMLTFRASGAAPQMSVGVAGQTSGSNVGSYDFGMVPAGMERATTVTVSNNGDAPLKIESIGVAGAGYRLGGDELGMIAVGSSANWTVHFAPPGDAASYRGALAIVSNDRQSGPQGVWTLELSGGGFRTAIAPITNSYDFGHVRVGATGTVTVERNRASVTSGGDVFRVAPGHSTGTWKLSFAPTSATLYTGELETDEGALALKGTGAKPQIAVAVEPHDWSRVTLTTTRNLSVTVSNAGTAELDISSIGVTGDGYSLVNAGTPRTVAPGGLTTFSLRFVPTLPENLTGTLSIVSDDPRQPHWTTSVTGRGFGPRLVLEIDGLRYEHNEPYNFDSTSSRAFGTVYVKNIGNESLGLENCYYESTSFLSWCYYPAVDLPATILPGDEILMRISGRVYWRWPTVSRATFISSDPVHPEFKFRIYHRVLSSRVEVYISGHLLEPGTEYDFGDVPVGGNPLVRQVRVHNVGGLETSFMATTMSGGMQFGLSDFPAFPVALPDAASSTFNLSFAPVATGTTTARLAVSTNNFQNPYVITLRGNGVPAVTAPSAWADSAQRAEIPTFTEFELADAGAPRFVGLGYADWQSRLWLAFDEPAQILSGVDARALADSATLSGFEVLANYAGGGAVEDIGVLRAGYRSGGVVMDLARSVVSADASLWARYTPPSDGVSGIYDMADPPNRISSVRLFMLPRSAVLDYDGDGFPDALEARLGGNPLVADDVVDFPEVALLREGTVGSPAAVAYSGIRADGVAAHLGVVTTGASNLAAYYLSDTFGYSGGYALGVDGYGCTGRFPADYALPLFGGGCAVVDFNNIRAGVEHRIGWLATNAAGYWAVAENTASRLPEMVVLRVPEFNMKRRNVFVGNSAAADATVVVGAFHDGPASSQSLTVSLSNVATADSPSSSEPDGFSVSVAGGAPNTAPGATPGGAADATTSATPDITSYSITGVHSGEDSKLWLAGNLLSSLTPDKYSLGKVTQTSVVRLGDDNLPPLFGRASLYAGTTAGANERHAVVVRGTENYIALLPVVQGSAQTASAFEVSPWDGAGGGPVAADDRIVAVNEASPVADGALVKIAFTASNPPATVRNTVSLEVAASSAGADTATTVLTWPVIDSADVLATIAGDGDNDGIPDVRDSYRLLNRLPIAVAGGVSGYPDRSSAGLDGWHHIRPLLPLHNQFVGSYATRAGLSFHTGFVGDARILARLPVATSGGQAIAAPEGQNPLAANYQPGIPTQMNYADFAASLSRDEFAAMAQQSRQDIAVVYNFRLHGVEPSVAQDATLAGGRVGVVIPLPESLRETTNILPLHYTNGAWSGFSTEPAKPATAGFAPLQAGACPDDSGVAGSPYRTASGVLNTRKRPGDACMVLYLTDGAATDRDGNINGIVEALIGLAAITLLR